ncbi:MAG: hypothetical protein CVU56_22265 [Deltaproteobacteria bacterium HGW-Deltaproteobacteria-14]|jgi:hypothetical protein|nr:MAG: hypothetical protein CVU56_22265 [Deltaproteobacteria bacterium HGW-Deltaproteobacteria-14]
MAVTIFSVEMDPNSDLDTPDRNLPTDLIVEIRPRNAAPSYHRLHTSEQPTVRRAQNPARRLRVRRLEA